MYKYNMQKELSNTPGLKLVEDSVENVVIEQTVSYPGVRVAGVCLGKRLFSDNV